MSSLVDLWAEARRRLDEKSESRLRDLEDHGFSPDHSPPSTDIDVLVALTDSKRQQCEKHDWTLNLGGHDLKLRDYATKIITWLQAFKETGDVLVQYDPSHAALPWAAVRFILQCAIAERDQMGAMLAIIEKTCYLVIHGRVYETLYLQGPDPERDGGQRALLNLFREELTRLYAFILKALAKCYATLMKSTAGRALKAAIQPDKLQTMLDELRDLEKRVQDSSLACKGLKSRAVAKHLEQIIEKLNQPLCRVEFTRVPVGSGCTTTPDYSASCISSFVRP